MIIYFCQISKFPIIPIVAVNLWKNLNVTNYSTILIFNEHIIFNI